LVQIDLLHDGAAWQARPIRDDAPGAPLALGAGVAAEIELSELLSQYTALACPAKGRGRLVFINLQKRLLSSVEAFAPTLEKHALSVGAPGVSTDEVFEPEDVDGEGEVGLSSEAEDSRLELAVAAASARLAPPPANSAKLLDRMRKLAQQHKAAADAKARALVAWVREQQCPAASLDEAARGASRRWTDRRVIIFTEYGHTKAYLRKLLESAIEGTDRAEERIRVFDGGMRMLSIPVVPRLIADDATLEAFNVWSVWTTAAKAAAGQWKKDKSRKLRARDDNPCAGIAAPDRDGDKELQLLYPNEFIALISCEDVPLEYRRLYALVTYLFLRGGELKALTWPDVDIDRGIVSVRRTYDCNTGRIKLRTAEAVGEVIGDVFPPLPESLARWTISSAESSERRATH
jgi:hypothetical protein